MTQVITDFVNVIFTIGAMFCAYKMLKTTKSGGMERGMRLIMLSMIFLLFSVIADFVSDLGFGSGVFDIAHDLSLAVFIMLMFFGLLLMVRDVSALVKLVQL